MDLPSIIGQRLSQHAQVVLVPWMCLVKNQDGIRCASAVISLTLIDTWDVFFYVDLVIYFYAWIVVHST